MDFRTQVDQNDARNANSQIVSGVSDRRMEAFLDALVVQETKNVAASCV